MMSDDARPGTELLERERFLHELAAALRLVAGGAGRTVLVSGEAGIGKTALVERFVAQHRGHARVLWGGCEALFTPRPLGPLRDIADQTASTLLKSLDQDRPSARMFSAFLDELAGSPRPAIVVFEDVHWADEATLDLIKFLGRRIHRVPAMFFVTYRDDEVGPSHPLWSVIGDLPSATVTRIALPTLSEQAVGTLAATAQREPEGLYAATGGNPFFVTEVLASGGQGVPATVRDAVHARAARLSPAARRTLDLASLIPTRCERGLLDHLLSGEAAIDECVEAGMLVAEGQAVRFRHEIARRAVEETVNLEQQRRMHGQILAFLESRDEPEVARLAYHAEAAGIATAVLKHATAAGRQAAAKRAHRQAFEQYARALRFAHTLDQRALAELYEAYALEARAKDRSTEPLEAHTLARDIWHRLGDSLREGRVLTQLGITLWRAGRGADAAVCAQEAIDVLETLPPGPELAEAYARQSFLCMLRREAAGAISWGAKAIALAGRTGAVEASVVALNAVGSTEIVLLERRDGIAKLEQAIRLAQEAELDGAAASALSNLGTASGEIRDYATAVGSLEESIAFCRQHDMDPMFNYGLAWLARVRFEQGRWAEAGDLAAQVVSKKGISPITPIVALTVLGRMRARRGDPGAEEALEEAWRLAKLTGDLQRLWPVAAARAERAWLSDEPDRIPALVGETLALAQRLRSRWAVGELAYWLWKAGALSSPPDNAAEPFAKQIAAEWSDAATLWERIGCPYERALALTEGEEISQRAALGIFDELGARITAEVVRRKLRARGVRKIPRGPRAATRGNPAGLTTREREVLALVAEGLQNADIAGRLVLSTKTVDHHVSAVLAKLNARSRAEAVAAAYRLGIIAPG